MADMYKSLTINGTRFPLAVPQSGFGAPNGQTPGSVGLTYMDANNGNLYKCVSVSGGVSRWEPVVTTSGGNVVVDPKLSPDSENPVQNKAVNAAVTALNESKADKGSLDLAYGSDGRLYITIGGKPIGKGVEIGSVPVTTWAITYALTNCSVDNKLENVKDNQPYAAKLTADSGYTMVGADVIVQMGGSDVTGVSYADGAINIDFVTGDVIITAKAVKEEAIDWYEPVPEDFERVLSDRVFGYKGKSDKVRISTKKLKRSTGVITLAKTDKTQITRLSFVDSLDDPSNTVDIEVDQDSVVKIENIPRAVNRVNITSAKKLAEISGVDSLKQINYFSASNTALKKAVNISEEAPLVDYKMGNNPELVDAGDLVVPKTLVSMRGSFANCPKLKRIRVSTKITNADLLARNCPEMNALVLDEPDLNISVLQNAGGAIVKKFFVKFGTETYNRLRVNQFAEKPLGGAMDPFNVYLTDNTKEIKNVFIWGDSITRMDNGGKFPEKLAGMVSDSVIINNYGRAGQAGAGLEPYWNNQIYSRGDINLFFLGANSGVPAIEPYYDRWIGQLTTDKYFVAGMIQKSYTVEDNEAQAKKYGDKFLNIHQYMIDNGFKITGQVPTEQDSQDIAAGMVPHSFLQSDYIHPNDYGAQIIATAFKEKLESLGYI